MQATSPRRWWPRLKVGCCVLVLAGLLALGAGRACAERVLDGRVAALEAAIAAARSDMPPRPAVIADRPGNAADGYRAVERLFRDEYDSRGGSTAAVERAFTEVYAHIDEGAPLTDAVEAVEARYGRLIEVGLAAIKAETCDWDHAYEEGVRAASVDLKAVKLLVCLLSLRAHRTPADTSLEAALELIVLGHDLGRHPTIVGAMMGCVATHRGYLAVARGVERGAPRAEVERVLGALQALGPLDARHNLLGDRLSSEVEIASSAGRAVTGSSRTVRRTHALGALYLAWDWQQFLSFWSRQEQLLRLPHAERGVASQRFLRDVERSWAVMTQIATPNLVEAMIHVETAQAFHSITRVLLAAALWCEDRGAWPERLDDLRDLLGGQLPQDPFRPDRGPLTLTRRSAELRVYSWGRDARDDGGTGLVWGARGAPDLIGSLRAPD